MLVMKSVFSSAIVAVMLQACGSPAISKAKLPAQLEDFGLSVNTFRSTLWPILRENCGTCHSTDGQNRSPLHGDVDAKFAHDVLLSSEKINLVNPTQSRIYQKVKDEAHNCWGSCSDNAAEILKQIKAWVAAGATDVPGNFEEPSILTAELTIPAVTAAYDPAPAAALTSLKFDLSSILGGTAANTYFELRISVFDETSYRIDRPRLVAASGAYVKGIHILINGVNLPEVSTYRAVDRDILPNFMDPISGGAMLMLRQNGPGQDKLTIGFNVLSTSSDPYAAAFSVAKGAFQAKCISCHAVGSGSGDLSGFFDGDASTERDFATYVPRVGGQAATYIAGNAARAFVVSGNPASSAFFYMIDAAPNPMKTRANPDLTAAEVAAFSALIQNYRP
jgi:mono/diheme cytochrome c family protein